MNKPQSVSEFFTSELGKRVLSAIVLLIVTLFLSWMGGLPFLIMSIALSLLLYFEWQQMVRETPFDGMEAILTVGFIGLLLAIVAGYLIVGLVGFLVLGLLLEMVAVGPEKNDVRWIGLGALYCAIPAITFPLIREAGGFWVLMFLFLVVWGTDIAAYFAGRRFGGAKLLPSVSPKKTWSGALGGLGAAIIVAILFASYSAGTSWVLLVLSAVVLSVVSQVGDLFESAVKRIFDVKDSSQLIPGHGGFLDRLDGLSAAAVPMAFVVGLSVT